MALGSAGPIALRLPATRNMLPGHHFIEPFIPHSNQNNQGGTNGWGGASWLAWALFLF
jgi:hypothetical protein